MSASRSVPSAFLITGTISPPVSMATAMPRCTNFLSRIESPSTEELTSGKSFSARIAASAMKGMKVNSPRGEWTFSKSQNPVQDFYLRKVVNGENRYQRVALTF